VSLIFSRLIKSIATITVLLGALTATASPIQFIYTGTGSGSIGSTTFSGTAFTIVESANTTNLTSCGATCQYIDASTTSIYLSGIGTFNFITGTRTFDNRGRVGLSRVGNYGADLYDVFHVGAAYDLTSSIGPIFESANLVQWDYDPMMTDGGILTFFDALTEGSFQAIASSGTGNQVPEPGSLALASLAFAVLATLRRRKGMDH